MAKTPFGQKTRLADQPGVQAEIGRAEARIGGARSYLEERTRDVWETLVRGDIPSARQRAQLALAAAHAATSALNVVEAMYRVSGASAIQASNSLDRCLRDIHTAAAHIGVGLQGVEAAGRARLGLEVGVTWW